MNVVLGLRGSAREITLELDLDSDALSARVGEAVASQSVLDLTDSKGQRYLVPARAIAYVQIGAQTERRVGFAID